MSLRVINRRSWISTISVILSAHPLISGFAWAESPPIASVAATLRPLGPDQPDPLVTAMAIDPSGMTLAVAGDDKTIRILRATDLAELAVLKGHRDLIRTLHYRADEKILLSSGNDGQLILWDRSQEYRQVGMVDDLPAIWSARFSPDGKQIAAVGFGSSVMLLGRSSDRLTLRCDGGDLRACAYDRTGKQLAVVGRSGHVHLYDPQEKHLVDEFALHAGRIRDCQFTSDGTHLVTVGEDGAAVLFSLKQAEVIRRIELLPCKLFSLAIIDDRRAAVAGSDNRIRIVDFESGLVLTHLDGHRGSISTLVYANGSLFSGGFDATLRRWPIALDGGARLAEKDSPQLPPK